MSDASSEKDISINQGKLGIRTAPEDANSAKVRFNKDVEIFPTQPLKQYDRGPVKAFTAKGRGSFPDEIFALVCEDSLTPRINIMQKYIRLDNPNMARLLGSGSVFWPPTRSYKFVLIYSDNLGQAVMADDTKGGLGLKQDTVVTSILPPLLNVMKDLRDKDMVHGAIRPSNMFIKSAGNYGNIILGDCLSTPASYNMDAVYETAERAIVSPLGRGLGTQADDLYALGVALTVMLRNDDPLKGLSERQIIERKLEDGTYIALTGKDRFTGAILELIRGLLVDDAAQRWSLDEVRGWIEGTRVAPKQNKKRTKASRPMLFNGKKFTRPELLADELHYSPEETAQILENGSLDQWLQRAIENKTLFENVQTGIKTAEDMQKGSGYTHKLATHISIALHPAGPIRYKDVNLMPSAVGPVLTEAVIQKRELSTFIDYFRQHFVMQWVNMQTESVVDTGGILGKFDTCRKYLQQKGVGFGIERCVYFSNENAPCLSETLLEYSVRGSEEFIHAMEHVSRSPSRPEMLLDRHMIAFLSVKDSNNVDPFLHELNSQDRHIRILGELKTFSTIQKRLKLGNFPGLSGWIAENLEYVYEYFHDRDQRKLIQKHIGKLKDKGDLVKIAAFFDEENVYKTDLDMFGKAMVEYQRLAREALRLKKGLEEGRGFGNQSGKLAGAYVSGIFSTIAVLYFLFLSFTNFFNG